MRKADARVLPEMFTSFPAKPLRRAGNPLFACFMSGDRIARAIARIETASRRIEEAASRAGAGDPEISRKYHELKGETGRALAELDALIGKLAP